MQSFNHISSIWQNQNQDGKLISADEMLHFIQSQLQKIKQKSRISITILVILAFLILLLNMGFNLHIYTHIGLICINLAVITAIYQFIQLQKHLKKFDYSKDNQSFIQDFKIHQQQKIKLYQQYYWWYILLLTIGSGMCLFELTELYSAFTICILAVIFVIWTMFCSLIIRKLTIQKTQEESEEWIQKMHKFNQQSVE